MHDFAQAGPICTLPRLNEAHLARVEAELAEYAAERPVTVILPCHGNDLVRPALARIAGELRGARWVHQVVLSMNGLPEGGWAQAEKPFHGYSCPVQLLWNDGPEWLPRHARRLGLTEQEVPRGKGFNVWAAIGALREEVPNSILAVQDCDVMSFRRVDLARLCLACAHPELRYDFAKMYYARVTDRLYGRATRLFFTPLVEAVRTIFGDTPLGQYFAAFRYALAGECAMTVGLARQLQFAPGYGLEVQMLCAVFSTAGPGAVCQVDGGTGYNHKHHPAKGRHGLAAMCAEVAGALGAALGVDLYGDRMEVAYRAAAEEAWRRSRAMAVMNGLPFDDAEERHLVEVFAGVLRTPQHAPDRLPSWQEIGTRGLAEPNGETAERELAQGLKA